ncbi:lycopene cyclase domain-containing protein [Conyzicola lurida]|uniref:Lycopene cyclase domain-containing protein n=1 Tax=Conyzicola lurida TaxID=1172621 RepID=A0A841ALZ0_9MICO|nr:lycopene cyclase domain-containing protein [Conyzicola lurida]MBB5845020.1 lycopene cyclase domain-containing protein [Conyzicola lurida]
MTYWSLNAIFLGAVALVALAAVLKARRAPGSGVRWPAVGIAAIALLVTTAVFDNVMIGIGLVDYNPDLISGAFVGIAPLEDFAYAVAAVVLLPSLWALLPARRRPAGAIPRASDGAPGNPDPRAINPRPTAPRPTTPEDPA